MPDTVSSSSTIKSAPLLTLAAGELPGYTGWARPSETFAASVNILDPFQDTGRVGESWKATIRCGMCSQDKQMWFYVRAYGPSIISGRVSQIENKHEIGRLYHLTLQPFLDPGVYVVELVVAFSAVPSLSSFPLRNQSSPGYEGYLVPGFPMYVSVSEAITSHTPLPLCSVSQLCREIDSASTRLQQTPPTHARWKVTKSNRLSASGGSQKSVTLSGYQQSLNSIGVQLQYERNDCEISPRTPKQRVKILNSCVDQMLKTRSATFNEAMSSRSSNVALEIVLIGDSVLRLQKELVELWIQQSMNAPETIKVTFAELYGGIIRCSRIGSTTRKSILDLFEPTSNHRRVVLWNSGMHDIHRLCGNEWSEDRESYLSNKEMGMSCRDLYKSVALPELWATIEAIPSVSFIGFMTTTAAWPKFGNYGVGWDPSKEQSLPLDSGFVDEFNRLAVDFLQAVVTKKGRSSTPVILLKDDHFWMTLSRPDNREVGSSNANRNIGKKMSHPGAEVIEAMVNIWLMLIAQWLCPRVLE